LPFQLSSRSISVPITETNPSRYSFQAIIVETSTSHVQQLREKFYQLAHPSKAKIDYPYTGMYPFVPLLKSKEWPISKIYQLAQVRVKIIDDLRTLYVTNLQDINNIIGLYNHALMQGFYGMTVTAEERQITNGMTPATQLIHSTHNTSRQHTQAVLVQAGKYGAALDQFTNLHNIFHGYIAPEFHHNIFLPTGQRGDSISSRNNSSYASDLLIILNPQDGEQSIGNAPKHFWQATITYAKALMPDSLVVPPSNTSTLMDIDALYEE
jgi:hypothetical protein